MPVTLRNGEISASRQSDQQLAIEAWADATAETEDDSTNRLWGALSGCEVSYLLLSLASLILLLTLDLFWTVGVVLDGILSCCVVFIHAVFCAYFLIYGIRAERPYEMMCFMATYLLICINLTMGAMASSGKVLSLVTAILSWVFSLFCVFLFGTFYVWKYHREGKLIRRTIVDQTGVRHKVAWVYRCMALIAMNLQMGVVAIIMTSLYHDFHLAKEITIGTISVALGTCIALGNCFSAIMFIVFESHGCGIFVILLGLGQLAEYVILLILSITFAGSDWWTILENNAFPAIGFMDSLAGIATTISLLVTQCVIYKNFGCGINTLVFRRARDDQKINAGVARRYGAVTPEPSSTGSADTLTDGDAR